jgi:hypothetical protein
MRGSRVQIATRCWLAVALASTWLGAQQPPAPAPSAGGAAPPAAATQPSAPSAAFEPVGEGQPAAPAQPGAAAPPAGAPAPPPAAAAQPAAPAQPRPRAPPDTQSVLGPYVRPPPAPDAPAPGSASAEAARPATDPRYRHDRFFFRFGAGFGSGRDIVDVSGANFQFVGGSPTHNSTSTLAIATEVALGGTPSRGLVVGAGIFNMLMLETKTSMRETPIDYEFASSQLALFSPFLDWYPWDTQGLHGQAGLGLASFVMGGGAPDFQTRANPVSRARAHAALGLGLMLGVGYEWWVAEQWSVGGLLRMLRGWTQGTDPDGVQWAHDSIAYSILMTTTYH